MREQVSNHTSIGNTNKSALKVVSIVAAVEIPERVSYMTDDKKFVNKKGLSLTSNKSNARYADNGREF